MFITFLQMGLANGVQPLLGYNFGSGDIKRFREVESYTKKCCLIVGIIATLLYFVFRTQIIAMFINDSEVINYGVLRLIGYMISGPVIAVGWKSIASNHTFCAKTGSAINSNALHTKCDCRSSWSHLWTGINRLYCSYIIGIFMEKGSKKFRIERNL